MVSAFHGFLGHKRMNFSGTITTPGKITHYSICLQQTDQNISKYLHAPHTESIRIHGGGN